MTGHLDQVEVDVSRHAVVVAACNACHCRPVAACGCVNDIFEDLISLTPPLRVLKGVDLLEAEPVGYYMSLDGATLGSQGVVVYVEAGVNDKNPRAFASNAVCVVVFSVI